MPDIEAKLTACDDIPFKDLSSYTQAVLTGIATAVDTFPIWPKEDHFLALGTLAGLLLLLGRRGAGPVTRAEALELELLVDEVSRATVQLQKVRVARGARAQA
jgi:hypothetical protein